MAFPRKKMFHGLQIYVDLDGFVRFTCIYWIYVGFPDLDDIRGFTKFVNIDMHKWDVQGLLKWLSILSWIFRIFMDLSSLSYFYLDLHGCSKNVLYIYTN